MTCKLFGLPVAPAAVTVTIPVRSAPVFAAQFKVMVPLPVPGLPDVTVSHESADAAVQFIVPVPVLDTVNVAVPPDAGTF